MGWGGELIIATTGWGGMIIVGAAVRVTVERFAVSIKLDAVFEPAPIGGDFSVGVAKATTLPAGALWTTVTLEVEATKPPERTGVMRAADGTGSLRENMLSRLVGRGDEIPALSGATAPAASRSSGLMAVPGLSSGTGKTSDRRA
jgi:hypothetical protein